MVLVADGTATGVLVKPSGNQATLMWAFPSMGVQMILTLLTILSGLLPGLVLWLIVWLAVKGNVDQMKQSIAGVLQGGAIAAQPGYGAFPQGQPQQALPQQGGYPQHGYPQQQQGYPQQQEQQGYPQQQQG